MIHDKDYMMRMVRQFSNLLSKLILDKNEGEFMEDIDSDFDTQLKDIFKMDFTELSSKSKDEIIDMVKLRESKDHADYYELLGNLFMFHFRTHGKQDFAEKAKTFYELYLTTSGIFAMPIINRIKELKAVLNIN